MTNGSLNILIFEKNVSMALNQWCGTWNLNRGVINNLTLNESSNKYVLRNIGRGSHYQSKYIWGVVDQKNVYTSRPKTYISLIIGYVSYVDFT